MAGGRKRGLVDSIQTLWSAGSFIGKSDGDLLDVFLTRRHPFAEAAFAEIVNRHGPMVIRVCKHLLCDGHAVEDAFQATFLALARKAHSVRDPAYLSRWLYGVAIRAAKKARMSRKQENQHIRELP